MPQLSAGLMANKANLLYDLKFKEDLKETFGLDVDELTNFCENLDLELFEGISEYFNIKIRIT